MLRYFAVLAALLPLVSGFLAPASVHTLRHARASAISGMNVPLRQGAAASKRARMDRAAVVAPKMIGETIEEFIVNNKLDPKLQKAVMALFFAVKEIAYKVRTASCEKSACFNEFGDEQLAIDILANSILFEQLKASGVVETASSEETPTEDPQGGKGFSVAFDPLDGSSIIDTNFAVGTIAGIWPGGRLVGVDGHQMVCSMISVYGPRTTMSVAFKDLPYTHEFLLIDDFSSRHGNWIRTNEFTAINEGKMFAPGNLRGTQDNPGYAKLFNYWMENKYQLRYTGGMVPDVNQLLVKGKGIFVNPTSPSAPAKLRVLYEVLPIALLVEKAGGKSSDGKGSALNLKTATTEDRTQVAYGSPKEVARFEEMVGWAEPYMVKSKDDPNWKPAAK
jgi:sedoheptulose-bisphosphatase